MLRDQPGPCYNWSAKACGHRQGVSEVLHTASSLRTLNASMSTPHLQAQHLDRCIRFVHARCPVRTRTSPGVRSYSRAITEPRCAPPHGPGPRHMTHAKRSAGAGQCSEISWPVECEALSSIPTLCLLCGTYLCCNSEPLAQKQRVRLVGGFEHASQLQ